MLFDLRSRGRRRTVQGVYLGLALLMGGGLVLFGVGAGNGIGGLLNAFSNNGSGSNQSQVVNSYVKSALKASNANPSSANDLGNLIQARWSAATSTGGGFNGSTGTFTSAGKKQLAAVTQDWQRYQQLTKSPSTGVARLAAQTYGILGQYGTAATAWEAVAGSAPNDVGAYECLAASAYAAGQTDKGDLAMNKSLSLLPKASRTEIKSELTEAKTSTSTSQQILRSNCEV
jgi:hypothetical protein